jgi:hypothetical protein
VSGRRDKYAEAGAAMRATLERAVAVRLSRTAWRVLAALLVEVGSYSGTGSGSALASLRRGLACRNVTREEAPASWSRLV